MKSDWARDCVEAAVSIAMRTECGSAGSSEDASEPLASRSSPPSCPRDPESGSDPPESDSRSDFLRRYGFRFVVFAAVMILLFLVRYFFKLVARLLKVCGALLPSASALWGIS